jgi:two-component sensor histidine kinase
MNRLKRSDLIRELKAYGVALAVVAIAACVRWIIAPGSNAIAPFITFFPAVLAAALYGGMRPGILAAVLSVLVAGWWFVQPTSPANSLINSAAFLANALLIAALAAHTRKLLAEREQQHRALETLHAEQGHRISNKLTLIGSLLSMQIKSTEDASVRAALEQAMNRVQSVARVHEHLQRGIAHESVNAETYLGELCRNMGTLSDCDRVQIDCRVGKIELDVDRALPFGMILTELMTNALKHAYPPPSSGKIAVAFDKRGNEFVLTVRDDGAGLPEGFERTGRLGVKVIRALVAQLKGTLDIKRENGTTFEIRAPA